MSEEDHEVSRPQSLAEGCVLGGNVLRSVLASDDFCSVWLLDPGRDAGPRCLRAIPEISLITPNARQRFRPELEFWKNRACTGLVSLYQCGWDAGYYYMLMEHVPEGSLADQLKPEVWNGEKLVNLALAIAYVLREVHSSIGPHGNLKPSNVFPLRDGTVLVSDFLLPLWLDELEAGPVLASHLLHPYRAPEQRAEPRDYDTRSDVYSFGLILLQCLTGVVPLLGETAPDEVTAEWPPEMLPVAQCCLDGDRERRYADGAELYDALSRATESHAHSPEPATQPMDAGSSVGSVWLEWDEKETARRVEQAGDLVREGRLETALDLLESLPPDAPGVADVLDEIDQRDQASQELASEAVRLAGMGNLDAAFDAIGEAEALFRKGEHVKSVKADLEATRQRQVTVPVPSGMMPDALTETLDAERYGAARPLLEKLLRDGEQTPELAAQVHRFKHGRARKDFLDNIRNARRFYLRGEFTESAQRWLEAARWLAPGPDRERLRRIARAAARGMLSVSVEELAAAAQQQPPSPVGRAAIPQLTPDVQAKLDAAARLAAEHDRRRLLVLLGILVALIVVGVGLLMAIWN